MTELWLASIHKYSACCLYVDIFTDNVWIILWTDIEFLLQFLYIPLVKQGHHQYSDIYGNQSAETIGIIHAIQPDLSLYYWSHTILQFHMCKCHVVYYFAIFHVVNKTIKTLLLIRNFLPGDRINSKDLTFCCTNSLQLQQLFCWNGD